jgi:hypothetical protein
MLQLPAQREFAPHVSEAQLGAAELDLPLLPASVLIAKFVSAGGKVEPISRSEGHWPTQ